MLMSSADREEVAAMKRDAGGQPVNKRVRIDGEGDEVLVDNARPPARRRPAFTVPEGAPVPIRNTPPRKKGNKRVGVTRKKSIVQEMSKRVEQYDLLTSLAQASSGITFGQIDRGDVDNVRKELQKALSGKSKKSSVNATGEHGEGFVPPNRHQVVRLTVHSEPVYALLDSGAIPNVMSLELARRLN